MKATCTIAAALLTALACQAQDEPQGPPPGGRPPHPPMPIFEALNTDDDDKLSAEEIEAASESLRTLDKNDDGELTPREIHSRPPRPPQAEGESDEQGPPQGGGRRPGQGGGHPPRGR